MDSTGLRSYGIDPGDGTLTQISYFGRGYEVRNPATGLISASLSEDGTITGQDLNVNTADPTFAGETLSDYLWDRAWGLEGWAVLPDVNGFSTGTSTEAELIELAWTLTPGRAYALRSEPIQYNNDTAPGTRCRIRYTTNGTSPSVSSTEFRQLAYAPGAAAAWVGREPLNIYMGGIDLGGDAETWRILHTYGSGNGATNVRVWMGDPMYYWIEDIGPLADDIGILHAGAGGSGSTSAKTTKVVEFGAAWTRSWQQGGTSVSFDDPMYQGYGDSFNGIQEAACGFPSLSSTLSGASIKKVQIYMYAEHWWNYTGGTLRLGYHGQLAEPATYPGSSNINNVTFTARGQGKWIDVTGWTGWVTAVGNGNLRGISISAPDNSPVYYGRFTGASAGRPRIRVTYTK
jgi:hypothetical protein